MNAHGRSQSTRFPRTNPRSLRAIVLPDNVAIIGRGCAESEAMASLSGLRELSSRTRNVPDFLAKIGTELPVQCIRWRVPGSYSMGSFCKTLCLLSTWRNDRDRKDKPLSEAVRASLVSSRQRSCHHTVICTVARNPDA